MREKFSQLIKSCGTLTVPAAETKSIGLAAGALVPGPPERPKRIHIQDLSIVRSGGHKPRHRDADGNSLNRQAVMVNAS
jgi:hypothetical protein